MNQYFFFHWVSEYKASRDEPTRKQHGHRLGRIAVNEDSIQVIQENLGEVIAGLKKEGWEGIVIIDSLSFF